MLSFPMSALLRNINCPLHSRYRPLGSYLPEHIYSKALYILTVFTLHIHSKFSSFVFLFIHFCKNKTFQQQFAHHEEGKQKHICFSRYHTGLSTAHIADQLLHTIRNMIETISPILMNSMCNLRFFS